MATQRAGIANMERVTDVSVPETILPIQYFDRLTTRMTDIPEKRLMFAVLLDAVIHLQRRDSRSAAEAANWIQGEGDGSPFSFENICESLGLEPGKLARALLDWHHGSETGRLAVPARQLRTTHPRIRPPRQRRRNVAAVAG